jgi:hypothetical protein
VPKKEKKGAGRMSAARRRREMVGEEKRHIGSEIKTNHLDVHLMVSWSDPTD